jgi:Rhomboid family
MMYNPGGPAGLVLLAGASGSIWGVMAALLAWLILNKRFLRPEVVSVWMRQLGFILLLNVFISMMPNISAAAHLGGGAIGFMTGCLLHAASWNSAAPLRTLAKLLLWTAPAILVGALMLVMETDPRWQRLTVQVQRQEQGGGIDALRRELIPVLDQIQTALEELDTEWQKMDAARAANPDAKQAADLHDRLGELNTQIREVRAAIANPAAEEIEILLRAARQLLDARSHLIFQLQKGCQAGAKWSPEDARELRELRRRERDAAENWKKISRVR